ncbi:MAG: TlpA family protein disulfide reductase [candidate division WOR-3 bacterium]|nr:TlpA family protein disulfide reductase [candidate division WOR-3 bacterium]MDH5683735.1 TlpA family protein disulfide reductase [candidate division WOR-3 bacterium]
MKQTPALFIGILFLISCSGSSKTSKPVDKFDFTLESLNRDKVTLSAQKGKVVILDFWTTWCPPCSVAIPKLIKLYDKYQDKGLLVLGIALDDKDKVIKKSRSMRINYPVLFGDNTISQNYEIISIPTLVLFDQKGKQVYRIVGFSEESFQLIEEKVIELLRE